MRLVLVAGVVVTLLLAGEAHAQDARMVPVTVDGQRVRLYPLSHSRENFAAFEAAGGKGAFHEFPPGSAGHYLRRRHDRWSAIVAAYLKRQGLPSEKP
jgi:hypothetical protein